MDLSSALSYPFKSIPKVLTIVLVCTISLVVFLAMLMNSYDWTAYFQAIEMYSRYEIMPSLDPPGAGFLPSLVGLLVVLLGQGLWLSGYGISVLRHVMEGFEKLPNVQFGQNMRDGLTIFLANLLYGIVAFLFFFVLLFVMGMFLTPRLAGLGVFVVIGSLVVAVPFFCVLGWSFFVGMARFVAEDNRQAMYQIPTNFGIARTNWKSAFSLTGYLVLLGIIFWFASQAINTGLQFVTVPFVGNSVSGNSFTIVFAMFMIVSYTLNIVQQFSGLHLIAQFAEKIGIMIGYEDEFDKF